MSLQAVQILLVPFPFLFFPHSFQGIRYALEKINPRTGARFFFPFFPPSPLFLILDEGLVKEKLLYICVRYIGDRNLFIFLPLSERPIEC